MVAQIEFPWRTVPSYCAVLGGLVKRRMERYHGIEVRRSVGVQLLANHADIGILQLGHIDLDESVQQRFRQAFSSSALVLGILGSKEAEVWVLGKRASDVGDVDRAAVIQARVETF